MAGFITLPQHRNPWVEQLPQFVQQLAFQKIGQKFQDKQAIQRQGFREQELAKEREFRDTLQSSELQEQNRQRIATEGFELDKSTNVSPIDGYTGDPENIVSIFKHNGKDYVKFNKKETNKESTKWEQLPPITIGGARVYRQKNDKGEIKYNRFPPKPPTPFGGSGGAIPKSAKDLRVEFINQSKVFVSVRDAYNRVEASAKDPSPAGDLSMIFNYMKILDPGSVVRESEFATAANSGSVPQRIRAQYNKVVAGERLDKNMRADFLKRSQELYKAQTTTHKQLRNEYTRLSKEHGFNASLAIVDYLSPDNKEAITEKDLSEADRLRQRYDLEPIE